MKAPEILGNLSQAIALLWRSSPRTLCIAVLFNVAVGLVPAVLLYVNAQLIERLTVHPATAAVLGLTAAYFILAGLHDGLGALTSFVVDTLRDSASMRLKQDVNTIVATFPDLSIHEDTDLRETALLATKASEEVSDLILHLHAVFSGVVTVAPILAFTWQTAWWIPVMILTGMIPTIVLRARAERESWDVREHHAATFNELRLLDRIFTQPEFAKDLRMYRMQERLLATWQRRYGEYLSTIKRVRIHNALRLAATAVLASSCLGVPVYGVINGLRAGHFTIGQLAFLVGALVQLKDGLAAIIYNIGDLLRVSYGIRPYRKLLALDVQRRTVAIPHASPPRAIPDTVPGTALVALRNVCLQYRDAHRAALAEINLAIHHREIIAIVGENGAGKSSLLKVLSELYVPTSGDITWSASNEPPRIIGVFQDFARFPLDVRGNLAESDMRQASACLRMVGLAPLADNPDTPLSTELAGGVDLSGGQWQRLAIARAMAHAGEADLLIFDEPTSALDPESEADIMRLILEVARTRTAVIVSHRLALTRFVDRIIVLDQGRIVDQGSHDGLVKQDGKYARMFRSQAMFYQDNLDDLERLVRPDRTDSRRD